MAKELSVFFEQRRAGSLIQDKSGRLRFIYDAAWLNDPARFPISQSLPLQSEPFADRQARPFFAGLLPEAEKRELAAKALGVSDRNDFALLDGLGGECAGALTLLPPDEQPIPAAQAEYEMLNDQQLAAILDRLPDRPLLAGEHGIRLSLAGAQDKLPVMLRDGQIGLPLNGAPSTHILKPPIRRFEDTVHNEGFCLELAKTVGLNVAPAEIRSVGRHEFLLVARYDRIIERDGTISRLHQEDFCQALGFAPELKYEVEGGPSLQQCFELVRRSVARPVVDLARLLDGVLFNMFIGNHDAHGKNYSLLCAPEGVQLAPLYDLTATAFYPELSTRFAMEIGDKYELSDIYPRHWERFAKDAGLAFPQLRRRLHDLAERVRDAAHDVRERFVRSGNKREIFSKLVTLIDERTRTITDRFAAEPKPLKTPRVRSR